MKKFLLFIPIFLFLISCKDNDPENNYTLKSNNYEFYNGKNTYSYIFFKEQYKRITPVYIAGELYDSKIEAGSFKIDGSEIIFHCDSSNTMTNGVVGALPWTKTNISYKGKFVDENSFKVDTIKYNASFTNYIDYK